MKKFMKVTQGKRFLSLILAVVMMATVFNMALPMLKLDASAVGSITTIDGKETITQERIVSDYTTKYDNYAAKFLNGASNPTNMVIPGLNGAQDYTIQGMTYYPARDWMLITAYYHATDDEIKNGAEVYSSKVFALDAATGEFVAMFSFLNPANQGGGINTEHGGGIAVSEKNIYYACGDDDRQIAYAPISVLEKAPLYEHTEIQLVDMVEFEEIGSVNKSGSTAYTAYVCYDDGVLWTGNFYDPGVLIAGVPIAATDYSAPANSDYNSMVFGYRLVGNSSEEEWNYLMGNVNGKDCRGNPSYVIGLNKSIKDIQYATVHEGKLYLSCSYGTGEGTASVSLGKMNPYSSLVVADIDLTQPGTKSTTITTKNGNRTVNAYDIYTYRLFDMMPMSEGLCVVNDNIFITFESASNKYLNEAGTLTGNCLHPVDVVWQLDQNELMNTPVVDKDSSIYYERIYNTDDIVTGEEYIIVHESKEKDALTQNNYLYALNAMGNFKGLGLSKSGRTEALLTGYNAMIGHPINYYSIEEVEKDGKTVERLYLGHPEEDDIEAVRWTLENINGTNYYIKNNSTYFAGYNNLYFNADKFTMAENGSKYLESMNIGQLVEGNGYFYFSNNGAYIWCNDGLDARYNNGANSYYATYATTNLILDGVTESHGTFHTDATNVSKNNIIGGMINNDNPALALEDGAFQIYRRVVDEAASTYESRVHTGLNAELQEDGTYTVKLETYAISPYQYQYVGEKPTDYIIVADTSSSMSNHGGTGYKEFTGELKVASFCTEDDTNKNTAASSGVLSYAFSDEDIYLKHTDDKMYKAYLAVRTDPDYEYQDGCDTKTKWMQLYYAYYIADDGLYYCIDDEATGNRVARTYEEWLEWVGGKTSDGWIQSASSDKQNSNSSRRSTVVYRGYHYRYDHAASETSEVPCIDSLRLTTTNIVKSIAAENSENRVAIVQNNGSSISQTALLSPTSADITNKINGFATGSSDGSPQNGGMDAVNSIISNNSNSGRNIAVIFLTDGIPDGSNPTGAANGIIATAKTAKSNGAFIYTVLIGKNEVSGFPKNTYLEALSSEYVLAESLTKLGGKSVDGVQYALSTANISEKDFVGFGTTAVSQVKRNNGVVRDNLNKQSILREQLSDAFKFPTNFNPTTDVKVELISGVYDEIGRFSFKESDTDIAANATDAAKVSVNTNVETKTLEITNYDYPEEYISKNRPTPGRKLRVSIKGLLADETKKIQNTSINNTDTTAIYKSLENMNDGVVFKKLPTEVFNIPKYTYVLDYGLQMLDTDVNGTLKSVSADLSAQRDANGNLVYKDESENGLVAIQEGNENLLYSANPELAKDSGYVLIQRDDGTYDWFEIEVVPASNVYYEETTFDITDSSNPNWTEETNGTSATNRDLPEEGDVDGFDNAYDNNNKYSNGTILATTVDKSNKRSDTASVTFTGNGFDLVSACGPNTGVQLVAIKDATGKTIKSYIVDTYYKGELASADGSVVSQVPIVNWRTNTFGEYTVETKGYYLSNAGALRTSGIKNNLIDTGLVMNSANLEASADVSQILAEEGIDAENVEVIWFDDNSILNGGTGAKPVTKTARDGSTVTSLKTYVDGFRIYNPLGTDSSDYAESEKNASYVNVIENLAPVNEVLNGIGFISGTLAEGENLSFSNYESVGPQGEFYLKANQAITFKVKANPGDKVMLGLRAVNGATTINVSSNNSTQTVNNIAINSATEMFYDISNCIGAVTDDNTEVQVTIQNGSGILALNQVKFSGGEKVNANNPATRSLARSGEATQVYSNLFLPLTQEDLIEVENTFTTKEAVDGIVKNGVVIPLVEEEEEIPGGNTTPDIPEVPGDDTNNDDTNTDSGEKEEFSIFSLLELLISLIEKLLHSAFGTGSLF